MPEYIPVFDVQDLPEEGLKALEVNGRAILIGRVNHQLVAFLDRCPHAAKPLKIGKLRGTELKCAWHGWTFDVLTGKSVPDHPAFRLTQYPVKIEGSKVLIIPPEPPQTSSL
ncbi:MAG: Rieske (2Fe-2S) protein [Candidatus Omnitrophica bacterium]|nr:Rieske (2Fe-2S) protein [Candidatus Omnitrophota bacterium]